VTSEKATIADLHRGLAHNRSTLTSILDRLAERGFITREVGAADRRTFVVTPTAKGRRVARRVYRHLRDLEQAVTRRVTSGEVKGFLKVVSAIEDEAHERTRRRSHRLPTRAHHAH
jgi:DNA-binding MarR family transcriptional regulator